MKLLTKSNAKKGLLLILKLFGFLFTVFLAFIDVVFGDSDEYGEDESYEDMNKYSEDYKRRYDSSYSDQPENLHHSYK